MMSSADAPTNQAGAGWLRRSLPLRAVLIVLLMAGIFAAALRWQQSRSIGAQVEAIGGFFHVQEYETELSARARLERLIDGQPTYSQSTIRFWHSDVNDEWLREHRDQLAAISDLQLLVADSPVIDAGLRELRGLNNITTLTLSATSVTDAGMEHVATMTGLQLVFLNQTQISSAGIERLASLPRLRRLGINDTHVTPADLAVLQKFPELRCVFIDESQATETGIANLQACTTLRELLIQDANDGIVLLLSDWGELGSLILRGTDVTDSSIPVLISLDGLWHLELHNTSVSAAGLADLQGALPDCRIYRSEPPPATPR